jgi:hypothetical protein
LNDVTLRKLWLTPKEAAVVIGTTADSITRDIREKQFPFEYKPNGRRYLISARSLGLVIDTTANEAAREGDQSLAAAAPAHA